MTLGAGRDGPGEPDDGVGGDAGADGGAVVIAIERSTAPGDRSDPAGVWSATPSPVGTGGSGGGRERGGRVREGAGRGSTAARRARGGEEAPRARRAAVRDRSIDARKGKRGRTDGRTLPSAAATPEERPRARVDAPSTSRRTRRRAATNAETVPGTIARRDDPPRRARRVVRARRGGVVDPRRRYSATSESNEYRPVARRSRRPGGIARRSRRTLERRCEPRERLCAVRVSRDARAVSAARVRSCLRPARGRRRLVLTLLSGTRLMRDDDFLFALFLS